MVVLNMQIVKDESKGIAMKYLLLNLAPKQTHICPLLGQYGENYGNSLPLTLRVSVSHTCVCLCVCISHKCLFMFLSLIRSNVNMSLFRNLKESVRNLSQFSISFFRCFISIVLLEVKEKRHLAKKFVLKKLTIEL